MYHNRVHTRSPKMISVLLVWLIYYVFVLHLINCCSDVTLFTVFIYYVSLCASKKSHLMSKSSTNLTPTFNEKVRNFKSYRFSRPRARFSIRLTMIVFIIISASGSCSGGKSKDRIKPIATKVSVQSEIRCHNRWHLFHADSGKGLWYYKL